MGQSLWKIEASEQAQSGGGGIFRNQSSDSEVAEWEQPVFPNHAYRILQKFFITRALDS